MMKAKRHQSTGLSYRGGKPVRCDDGRFDDRGDIMCVSVTTLTKLSQVEDKIMTLGIDEESDVRGRSKTHNAVVDEWLLEVTMSKEGRCMEASEKKDVACRHSKFSYF
eukprot:scaffold43994_cov66-Cyclotella_meneghiniana.AAC.3